MLINPNIASSAIKDSLGYVTKEDQDIEQLETEIKKQENLKEKIVSFLEAKNLTGHKTIKAKIKKLTKLESKRDTHLEIIRLIYGGYIGRSDTNSDDGRRLDDKSIYVADNLIQLVTKETSEITTLLLNIQAAANMILAGKHAVNGTTKK